MKKDTEKADDIQIIDETDKYIHSLVPETDDPSIPAFRYSCIYIYLYLAFEYFYSVLFGA
jgi:hypothetical protein